MADPCTDDFSARLGYATELASSLIKLQVQNLSSMDADYWYSTYHHSHPILTERLKAIGWKSEKGRAAANDKAADSDVPVRAADREL